MLTAVYSKPHFTHLFIHTKQFILRSLINAPSRAVVLHTKHAPIGTPRDNCRIQYNDKRDVQYNAVPLFSTIRRMRRHTAAVQLCRHTAVSNAGIFWLVSNFRAAILPLSSPEDSTAITQQAT